MVILHFKNIRNAHICLAWGIGLIPFGIRTCRFVRTVWDDTDARSWLSTMLFNSFEFAIFFPVVTGIYFLLTQKFRCIFLLAVSCYFYMAFVPKYILILFLTIVIDYFAGLWISRSVGSRKKWLLITSIIANVSILFLFKYFNFFNSNLRSFFDLIGMRYSVSNLEILLPIGLSFHTFQAMSYTIEVYRGKQEPERSFIKYALYVMFYPQLVAGPIERPQNILSQFHVFHRFEWKRVEMGLQLMTWGFFKKLVIADRLAILVNEVYAKPDSFSGVVLILATYSFAYQIYCDFSGYTDIARGAAQVMGFDLMVNFDRPYSSTSITEFWRRWHISLSTWFRDYVYIPLGGSKERYRNVLIVFLLSGLWHGANWTFVVWGLLHGVYLIASTWLASRNLSPLDWMGASRFPAVARWSRRFVTFNLVCLAWVYFRAENMTQANSIVMRLADGLGSDVLRLPEVISSQVSSLQPVEILVAAAMVFLLELVQAIQARRPVRESLQECSPWIRAGLQYACIAIIFLIGKFSANTFIYFQF